MILKLAVEKREFNRKAKECKVRKEEYKNLVLVVF